MAEIGFLLNWNYLSNLGIRDEHSQEMRNKLRIINQFISLTIIIAIFFIPVSILTGSAWYITTVLFGIPLFSLSLYLNRAGMINLSQWVFILTFFIAVTCLSCVLGPDSGIPFAYLPVGILSLMFFRSRIQAIPIFLVCLLMIVGFYSGIFGEPRIQLDARSLLLHRSLLIIIVIIFVYFFNAFFRTTDEIRSQKLIYLNQENSKRNSQIMKSIQLAGKIQSSLFPPDPLFKSLFPESFVIYKPKEVVSGDFYWVDKVGGVKYLAIIDCTGHGVPGAFVSILGHQALNRCIHEMGLLEPADILNKLHEIMYKVMKKEVSILLDGMDMSLISFNAQTNILTHCGAQNSILLIRKDEAVNSGMEPEYRGIHESIYKINGQRQSVGSEYLKRPFVQSSLKILQTDTIYLYTDGYVDQFGGSNQKKMMHKPFKKLLLSIQNLEMEKQRKAILRYYENWKEDIPQIDDVCVIGIKVK